MQCGWCSFKKRTDGENGPVETDIELGVLQL